MADKKRKKLSLNRKTISGNSSLFNCVGNRQASLRANKKDKAVENIIIDFSSDSDTDRDLKERHPTKRLKSEKSYPTSDNDVLSYDIHRPRDTSGSTELKSRHVHLPNVSTKQSRFLDVDNDLQKLRMMFLKIQAPKLNVRTLASLPEFSYPQVLESNTPEKENTIFPSLPEMCKQCLRRKPTHYSGQYDTMIEQELNGNGSLSVAQRSHQLYAKGEDFLTSQDGKLDKQGKSGWSLSVEREETFVSEGKSIVGKKRILSGSGCLIDLCSEANKPDTRHKGDSTMHSKCESLNQTSENTSMSSTVKQLGSLMTPPDIEKSHRSSNNLHRPISMTKQTVRGGVSAQPHLNISKTLVSSKREIVNKQMENSDITSNAVQCCPLCQINFEKWASQIEVDSHIALCLSMSGGDTTW